VVTIKDPRILLGILDDMIATDFAELITTDPLKDLPKRTESISSYADRLREAIKRHFNERR
jgi:hypothetical protein